MPVAVRDDCTQSRRAVSLYRPTFACSTGTPCVPFPAAAQVYHPCVLQAKKRYVGFMYESPGQATPIFDAKGIETVSCRNSMFVLGHAWVITTHVLGGNLSTDFQIQFKFNSKVTVG